MAVIAILNKFCGRCEGTGKVMQSPPTRTDANGNRVEDYEINCPECAGTGKMIWGEAVEP